MAISKWESLSLTERVLAVKLDCFRHPDFALIATAMHVGKAHVRDDVPTAATNGKDMFFGSAFIAPMSRKELRYLILHEALHISLHHCTAYRKVSKRYGGIVNKAMDYVVNNVIEETDPQHAFVDPPKSIPPLYKPEYKDLATLDILRLLINEQDDNKSSGKGDAGGASGAGGADGTLDEHMMEEIPEDQIPELTKAVEEALREGKIIADKIRGASGSGGALDKIGRKSNTDWRHALREFITSVTQGDDYSRFNPPNKRMLAHGILFPTHFTEATGELIIANDTSGSMDSIMPIVMGEIAKLAQQAKPERVRVLWWDTAVCGDQVFMPHEYEGIATALKPMGGGGTTVSCVAQYIAERNLKARGVIYLTDGYIESDYIMPDMPALWGVVDNDSFVPQRGKVVRIHT